MAINVGDAVLKITGDSTDLDKEIQNIDKKFTGLSAGAAHNMQVAGAAMTGIGAVMTGVLGMATSAAMDAVESENLFAVALGNSAEKATAWSKEVGNALGINEYELRKNMSTLYQMTSSMGIAKDSAYDMSSGLTQLAYDMASFYNLKPEEAFMKLQAGITGEAEPLKRLGILIDETTIKTYAYTNGIAEQGEELTQQQKVMARYGAIMEQTANAQGDLARTMDSPTNMIRTMKSQMEELKITIGNGLLPIFSKMLQALMPIIKNIMDWVDKNPKLTATITIAVAVLGGLMAVLGPLLMILPGLISLLPMLGAAFTIATGPVGIIIVAIGALIAIGVLLAKNWDTIVEKARVVFSRLKDFILAPYRAIAIGIESAINFIIRAMNRLSFDIPDWVPVFGGRHFGFDIPEIRIPSFEGYEGVIAPNLAAGTPILSVVHAHEYIGQGKGGGTTVNNFYIEGSVTSENDLVDTVRRGLLMIQDRNYSTGIA